MATPDALSLIENGAPGAGVPDAYTRGVKQSGFGGGGSGLVLVASGTISSPVAHLDLLLPDVYADFELRLVGWQVSEAGEDSLQYQLSFDDGATFSSADSYRDRYLESDTPTGSSVSTTGNTNTSGQISNGYPSQTQTPGQSLNGTIQIFPGSVTLYPALSVFNNTNISGTPDVVGWESASSVYLVAGKASAIRLLTVGNDIATGMYWLYGRPSP